MKNKCESEITSGLGTHFKCKLKKGHSGPHQGLSPYVLRDGLRQSMTWTEDQALKFGVR